MKTRLILDSALCKARSHLLRTLLTDAAKKSGLQLVNDNADAELWVLVGQGAGDASLNGKTAFQGRQKRPPSIRTPFCSAPVRRPHRIRPPLPHRLAPAR
ncbi:PTS system fructose-specific transporter subunits IIBC [Sodalis glossinidius str. 'morsitans']|uniref:PTS system fructose-specific transporter subunits IIBC n=1 Tax=Sodalis glossinidius (strain morsitans) TaxID=343509 RepID=A0A193QI05_SODGM|nr:PTS system fructose-specific transporter subunits IIBC [Sodalis glossinidius str. 'morsitans']